MPQTDGQPAGIDKSGPLQPLTRLLAKLNQPPVAFAIAAAVWGIVHIAQGGGAGKSAQRDGLPKDISRAPAPNIRKALRGEMSEQEMAELLYRINRGSLAHELYPEQYPDLVEFWRPS